MNSRQCKWLSCSSLYNSNQRIVTLKPMLLCSTWYLSGKYFAFCAFYVYIETFQSHINNNDCINFLSLRCLSKGRYVKSTDKCFLNLHHNIKTLTQQIKILAVSLSIYIGSKCLLQTYEGTHIMSEMCEDKESFSFCSITFVLVVLIQEFYLTSRTKMLKRTYL